LPAAWTRPSRALHDAGKPEAGARPGGRGLAQASFPQDEFDKLKQEELAGLEANKSEPMSLAPVTLMRHLSPYPRRPRYALSIDEQIEEIKTLTLDRVKAFTRTSTAPPTAHSP